MRSLHQLIRKGQRYKKLTLLHSNDMHGDFLAEKRDDRLIGGVSMLSGYVSKVREEEKNALYCIAGDMFRGSVIDSEYLGLSTIQIMNMLSPDIVTIGNHETDYGVAHLLFLEKCARFPIVNANLYIKNNGVRLFRPCRVIEKNGIKILFIGILTQEVIAQTKNDTDTIIGALVDVEDAAREVGRICNTYNSTDIDLTVLLTHIGFEEDKKLAALLDPDWGVDIIIGGHSHTFLEKPEIVNDILIVQAGTGTDQIGRFDLIIDTEKNCVDSFHWMPVPINSETCVRDERIEKMISALREKTDIKYGRVLTRFEKKLTNPTRLAQTELGGLMADILKTCCGLDIMLLGSGSIRTEELGPVVTRQDLVECYPYSGPVYMVEVTGAQLRHMLKRMLRDEVWQGEHAEFFQLSKGLYCRYSRAQHEFLELTFEGEPVEDDNIYTVGLQKFHYLNSKDSFDVTQEELDANMKPRTVTTSDQDTIIEYLTSGERPDGFDSERLVIVD